MKFSLFIFFLFISNCFANSNQVVPISIKTINYKEQVFASHYKVIQVNQKNIKKYKIDCKEYVNINQLKKNKYRAKHYIIKNKVICKKDLYRSISKRIKFNFGFLEIERDGEIIKETEQYIKIKNLDGKIEKIYKDGSQR